MGLDFLKFNFNFGNFGSIMPFPNVTSINSFFIPKINYFPAINFDFSLSPETRTTSYYSFDNLSLFNYDLNINNIPRYDNCITIPFIGNNEYICPFINPYSAQSAVVKEEKNTETKTEEKIQQKETVSPPQKSESPKNNVVQTSPKGRIDKSYQHLSQSEAERKAKNDPNLERLTGGANWSVADTFETDIPYAKKGTGKILQKVSEMIGEEIVVTSALGTGGKGKLKSPHGYKNSYCSHHNAENPKLDIRAKGKHVHELACKLRKTGYFSRVFEESDHLDVQINPAKYNDLNLIA